MQSIVCDGYAANLAALPLRPWRHVPWRTADGLAMAIRRDGCRVAAAGAVRNRIRPGGRRRLEPGAPHRRSRKNRKSVLKKNAECGRASKLARRGELSRCELYATPASAVKLM